MLLNLVTKNCFDIDLCIANGCEEIFEIIDRNNVVQLMVSFEIAQNTRHDAPASRTIFMSRAYPLWKKAVGLITGIYQFLRRFGGTLQDFRLIYVADL